MLDPITTIRSLIATVSDTQSSAVLRERINLIKDQLALADKAATEQAERINQLVAENKRLRQQLDKAKDEISAHTEPDQYTEHRGALFKKNCAGKHHVTVYCPICRKSTFPFPPGEFFNCGGNCGWVSSFTERDLPSIIAEIE